MILKNIEGSSCVLQGLGKTGNVSQDNRNLGRDLNSLLPKYEAGTKQFTMEFFFPCSLWSSKTIILIKQKHWQNSIPPLLFV
jgi:hypothetical protein